MSRNGSIKEAILGLYLKERPQIISEVLGFEVHHIALEQKHGAYHVDLKAVDKKRRIPVMFEFQLGKANKSYLNRIKSMLNKTPEGVIVWVAGSFGEEMIIELRKWLPLKQPSYVDFYAISLNSEVIPILEQLNELYKLEIYDNLHLLDDIEPMLSIELQSERIPMSHCGHLNIEPAPLDYKVDQDLKRGLLLHLRKAIPQFLNFHYDKKANQYDKILSIGAGKYGVVYRCSAMDRRGKAFIELYFDRCMENEYEAFKLQKSWLQEVIHPEITVNNRRIGVYFAPANNHEKTFEIIGEVFKKMIDTFSPCFYGGKGIEKLGESACTTVNPNATTLFVSMPMELPELEYGTEDSYRIWLEEMGERFIYR